MEFLVNIEIEWPPDGGESDRERLFAAELTRGRELAVAGVMKRLWRVPGRWANWGLWEAEDATALHEALSSLPLWPWMNITVHPLARHTNDPAGLAAMSDTPADTQETEAS
ncbi:MAG TPA: muconolactone Delta-isomerase family protein [Jiangellaceae bacterium]